MKLIPTLIKKVLFKNYTVAPLFFLSLAFSVNALCQTTIEMNVHSGLQSTLPTLGKIGVGIAPEHYIGTIGLQFFFNYDRYGIQFYDKTLTYTEWNYGLGGKIFFSGDEGYLFGRIGQSMVSYSDKSETAYRYGVGVGVREKTMTYSIGVYQYVSYIRDLYELSVGYVF